MKNVLTIVCLSFLLLNNIWSQPPILSTKDTDFSLKMGYSLYQQKEVILRLHSKKMLDLIIKEGQYIIIIITENGVKDIDAHLFSKDGLLLSKDTDYQDGGVAYLTTEVLQSQLIRVKLNIYEAWCTDCAYTTKVFVYWRSLDREKKY